VQYRSFVGAGIPTPYPVVYTAILLGNVKFNSGDPPCISSPSLRLKKGDLYSPLDKIPLILLDKKWTLLRISHEGMGV
jgi:hypothetical protein